MTDPGPFHLHLDGRIHRPPFGDKLSDWNALAEIGGETFLKGKRVLDIGPQFGLDALMFAGITEYTILDTDPSALEHVGRMVRMTGCDLRCERGDVCMMVFADESFDVVIDFSSLDNCATLAGLPAAVRPAHAIDSVLRAYQEIHRVLVRGGTLLTSFANQAVLPEKVIISGDWCEVRQYHGQLTVHLNAMGFDVAWTYGADKARGGLSAVKR